MSERESSQRERGSTRAGRPAIAPDALSGGRTERVASVLAELAALRAGDLP